MGVDNVSVHMVALYILPCIFGSVHNGDFE